MILFAARAVKTLLLLAVFFAGWRWLRHRLTGRTLLCLGMLAVLFATAANFVSGFVPPVRDEVTLTAQGEKCNDAKEAEVYLAGYTIDGASFTSGESLVIKEGHWFWSGETYAWRPEADSRQPENMTRTVVLRIPVGWNRTLDFSGNAWRGLVQVDNGKGVWICDTYAEKDSVVQIQIGRSETSDLIRNQIRSLAVYSLVFLLLTGFTGYILAKIAAAPDRVIALLKENQGKLLYGGIACAAFLLMFHYAGKYSLWIDELG